MKKNLSKWKLVFQVIPFLAVILVLKYLIHYLGYEFLGLSSLLGALISANVFLIGFLITGVLSDFKESEKLPSDLACSLEALADECFIMVEKKGSKPARACLDHLAEISSTLLEWFQKKVKTHQLMDQIFALNSDFLKFESETQANFIVRMKQEQNLIRKIIHRIHNVRELSFVQSGYAIVEAITFILIAGMIVMKIDPYYESVFFVTFVSFFLIYMIVFLKDLDNPFGYYQGNSAAEEVSLKPIADGRKYLIQRIQRLSE
jgi:hypothetical protein